MSRKFFLAVSLELIATVALFSDKLDGGEFVMLAVAVLGVYGYHNIKDKK